MSQQFLQMIFNCRRRLTELCLAFLRVGSQLSHFKSNLNGTDLQSITFLTRLATYRNKNVCTQCFRVLNQQKTALLFVGTLVDGKIDGPCWKFSQKNSGRFYFGVCQDLHRFVAGSDVITGSANDEEVYSCKSSSDQVNIYSSNFSDWIWLAVLKPKHLQIHLECNFHLGSDRMPRHKN
jgi:hypothetical protein